MYLEALAQALGSLGNPYVLLYTFIGIAVGLIFGVIPGIGSLLAMALFLPFAFTMRPEYALPLMIAVDSVSCTGGSITAILLNIPGDGTNAATIIDGYPMAQKGQAGRALGAALTSSGLGGLAPVILALVMIPLVLPMILAIRSADLVFVIVMGLAFIAVLGRGSMVEGLVSGGLGLLISFVGLHAAKALPRFTFGSLYLFDGIQLVPLALGIFALPEAISFASTGGTIAQTKVIVKGMQDVWEGAKDVLRHWTVWLRSTIIGYIIGVIPGVGASTSIFIAYGQAKATSKHPEKFGTGTVEGVIAPESANNAKEAGALLTTLALGIPGSASMAILLGALMVVGLIPGPQMITEHLDLSLNLLLVVAFTNVVGAAICIVTAQQMAKIALVPTRIIAPLVMVIAFVGTFAYRGQFNDVITALVFTVLGVAMKRFGFNRPALFLGYVLGTLFEKYFFIALGVEGPLFFMRPISLTLILITVALFAFEPMRKMRSRRSRA